MRDPVMVDWYVSKQSWERFREHVRSKYGSVDGYLRREVEAAMREYADIDEYAALETKIDRLVQAAGRNPNRLSENKSPVTDGETVRVPVTVEREVKAKFKKIAAESDSSCYGEVFARAILTWINGGRAARVTQKLDRIVDDAEELLGELNDGESELTAKQKKILRICTELDPPFPHQKLREKIHTVAGEGDTATEATVDDYTAAVTDRLSCELHPNIERNPSKTMSLWIGADRAEDMIPDGVPRETFLPVERLDLDEEVRRIQYELALRATTRSSGKYSTSISTIHEEILDHAVSQATAYRRLQVVTAKDGFSFTSRKGGDSVRVDLNVVATDDPEFCATVKKYAKRSQEEQENEKSENGDVSTSLETLAAAGKSAASNRAQEL